MDLRLEDPWLLPGFEIAKSTAPSGTEWIWDRVARAPADIEAHVRQGGLRLTDAQVTDATLFVDAAAAIGAVPSLAAIVAARVGEIHLLKADPGYDVSHSEPAWVDRIFVSLPERRDRVGALRLAESIIHEAMHLHLTLLERDCPLVRDVDGQTFSPWRQTHRPFGGVLHGVYVFVRLAAFFVGTDEPQGSAAARHVHQRLTEIADELASIDQANLKAGLTSAGRQLVKLLMQGEAIARSFPSIPIPYRYDRTSH
ncbi:MAG: aKG-HExxH-type peptide beta-hydroxylase [Caulobacteraceae bacterium]